MPPTPPISAGRPIVMSGPSGTGKSTLLNKLFEKYPDSFKFSVSCTTRQPRAGETPGVSYHYITRDEFKAMIERGELIEHAEFSGNMYGTPFKSINPSPSEADAGKPQKRIILDLELNGVKSMKNSGIPCLCIFIAPPSIEELRSRLENRKSETPESLAARIASAQAALDYAHSTPSPYDAIIVNGSDVDAAAAELERIIF
ncbi:putative guanylate kinase, partial [Fimicolochytrium jonesii]|uniref:putative guanylate kinase n=1 Tax=Fimicolochytrium jonesii TaxID=1396493 RepID=UPI0022FE5EF4